MSRNYLLLKYLTVELAQVSAFSLITFRDPFYDDDDGCPIELEHELKKLKPNEGGTKTLNQVVNEINEDVQRALNQLQHIPSSALTNVVPQVKQSNTEQTKPMAQTTSEVVHQVDKHDLTKEDKIAIEKELQAKRDMKIAQRNVKDAKMRAIQRTHRQDDRVFQMQLKLHRFNIEVKRVLSHLPSLKDAIVHTVWTGIKCSTKAVCYQVYQIGHRSKECIVQIGQRTHHFFDSVDNNATNAAQELKESGKVFRRDIKSRIRTLAFAMVEEHWQPLAQRITIESNKLGDHFVEVVDNAAGHMAHKAKLGGTEMNKLMRQQAREFEHRLNQTIQTDLPHIEALATQTTSDIGQNLNTLGQEFHQIVVDIVQQFQQTKTEQHDQVEPLNQLHKSTSTALKEVKESLITLSKECKEIMADLKAMSDSTPPISSGNVAASPANHTGQVSSESTSIEQDSAQSMALTVFGEVVPTLTYSFAMINATLTAVFGPPVPQQQTQNTLESWPRDAGLNEWPSDADNKT